VYARGGSERICDDAQMGTPSARRSHRWPLVTAVAVIGVLSGCGGDDGDSACGPITREALDPAYVVHVLGTDTDVKYTSDPPTSGPHQLAPPVDGVVDEPIARPVQVGILERGDVLVQHDPDLDAPELARLEDLAGDGVVVAPNPDLPSPVVATAWLYKRACDAVDTAALQTFIDERRGKGPDQ
jgi:Protein of unknown function (DUF3105)